MDCQLLNEGEKCVRAFCVRLLVLILCNSLYFELISWFNV